MTQLVLATIATLCASARSADAPEAPKARIEAYDLSVRFLPFRRTAEVSATLRMRTPARAEKIRLYLTSSAEIVRAALNGTPATFERDRNLIPFFSTVDLHLREKAPGQGDRSDEIRLEYSIAGEVDPHPLMRLSASLDPGNCYLMEHWCPTTVPLLTLGGTAAFVSRLDKAPFRLEIRAPKGYATITAGRLIQKRMAGDESISEWHSGPVVPMVVPVLAGTYGLASHVRRGWPIDVYTRESLDPDEKDALLDLVTATLDRNAAVYGDLPRERARIVVGAFPGFARGFPFTLVLPDHVARGLSSDRWMSTIAHEVAHTWFGNLVTGYGPGGNEILAEGLATYAAIATLGDLEGPALERRKILSTRRNYLSVRARDVPLARLSPSQNVFSAEAYHKGALVFYELRRLLGRELLARGLRAYLAEHRLGFATLSEFVRDLENSTGVELGGFADDWFHGTDIPFVAVDEFKCRRVGPRFVTSVILENRSGVTASVRVIAEGKAGRATRPVVIQGNESVEIDLRTPFPVEGIEVDEAGLHGMRDGLVFTARDARQKGELDDAEEIYRTIVRRLPCHGEANYGLGRIAEAREDHRGAIRPYRTAAESPDGPAWVRTWAMIRLGDCHRRLGNRSDAIRWYQRARETGVDAYGSLEAIERGLEAAGELKR